MDRTRRFDDHRGGESYRPGSSRGYGRRSRSPPRIRSPPNRLVADTWVPSTSRTYGRTRSRSPLPFRRRSSRSPQSYSRDTGPGLYPKTYISRRFSPRRDVRPRSPISSSRRPRSPYVEDRSRDIGWSQNAPITRHARDSPPNTRDTYRKERRLPDGRQSRPGSPPRHGLSPDDDQRLMITPRVRSPLYGGRRDIGNERYSGHRRRSQSPHDYISKRPSASDSLSNSRRSSPLHEKANPATRGNRSRSPPPRLHRDQGTTSDQIDRVSSTKNKPSAAEANAQPPVSDQQFKRTSYDQNDPVSSRPLELQRRTAHTQISHLSNVPSQPKAFASSTNLPSPSGPPHGPKTLPSHPRASNLSLLSAPTRPRGASSFKDSGWAGSSLRRGPAPVGAHGTPIAPRNNQLPTSSVESHRPRAYHQISVSGPSSHTQRYSKHLAGLSTIVPGGKTFQSELDTVIEKRLSQLDTDKDRLFDQIAESQKLKRVGLRDWDRLDRENSICALKSELAEGHLQRITDIEGALGRAMF
ncbi:hypothetical protein BJX99DRAFT_239639 [Aspergillus californicus]